MDGDWANCELKIANLVGSTTNVTRIATRTRPELSFEALVRTGLAALAALIFIMASGLVSPAHAQDAANAVAAAAAPVAEAAPEAAKLVATLPDKVVDKGDVTWMMVSTLLVLLMIVPGLALFYGGLCAPRICCPC